MREIRFKAMLSGMKFLSAPFDWYDLRLMPQAEFIVQSTGIKDRKSKEIFEGDIVFDEDGEFSKTCKIEWNNESASFVGISIDDDGGFTMEEIDGEIIGNIYENPELLTPNTQ